MKENEFAWSNVSVVEFQERIKIMEKKPCIPSIMTEVDRVEETSVFRFKR